ncbi:RpiR family transcriptional regulator (plasmid) [Ketogulonicigenium robustum]|uniref:RpiR family transcriptional regulator n=1 Tax=Ketogulonicigenium robustum TaxID=92947 RepID=A0A1W6P3J1_9RHOB|nr:MurR/RpiR family transcriptional regulator [Ketogulonicigenium robustum]ARO16004.1 RpiR family transcriptional regulator [Ketogulonicigenium robustum]
MTTPNITQAALARHTDRLSPAMRRVATYLADFPAAAAHTSALQIATATGTSDATVVRTIKALGFAGLPAWRDAVLRAQGDGTTNAGRVRRTLRDLPRSDTQALDTWLTSAAGIISRLHTPSTLSQITRAAASLRAGPRIAIFAQGSARPVGIFVHDMLVRFGFDALLLDRRGADLADQMLLLRPDDSTLMIAVGPPYPEALGVLALLAADRRTPVLIGNAPQWAADARLGPYLDTEGTAPETGNQHLTFKLAFFLMAELLLTALLHERGAQATLALERLDVVRATLDRAPKRPRAK